MCGEVVVLEEWKKKKEEERRNRSIFSKLMPVKSTAQKIKEALAKYGSHKKNKNNDTNKDN